ncbi:Z1 domain-containing protein, partial [Chloroflexota bacterium]
VLLPIYEGYVGGDFYFKESKEENSLAYYVYEELSIGELDALKKPNRKIFKLEEALTHSRIEVLRKGILNFIVGACIRRMQQRLSGAREQKYCFVVHTEHGKQAHEWQIEIIEKLKDLFMYSASNNRPLLSELVRESYDELSKSIGILNSPPSFEEVLEEVVTTLKDDCLMIRKVNSETAVEQLLDDNGELERTAPLNIFTGGQILDRGVTIRNLIGFYYGRRPGRFQQDTVLQHSRMFGSRPDEDLAVTRFYTALNIYLVMERINEFDNALREAFEKEAQPGVVFICKDPSNRILPCSPNKISISTTTSLTPYKRMLPVGFQTDYKTKMSSTLEELDNIIYSMIPTNDKNKPVHVELSIAQSVIDMIDSTLIFEPDWEWDIEAFKASMEFLSKNCDNPKTQGKVWCIVRTGRNISRFKYGGKTFSDAPDTPQDELEVAKQVAIDIPALILLRQEGLKEKDWRGSPFWWPVLVAPKKMRAVVFASEFADVD